MVSYEHKVKNIYLGEPGWSPGEDTIAYYKFDGNLNDSSGNNKNLTATRTPTYGTNYIEFNGGLYLTCANFDNMQHNRTLNVYFNRTPYNAQANSSHLFSMGTNSSTRSVFLGVYTGKSGDPNWSKKNLQFAWYGEDHHGEEILNDNTRYNLVYTYNYTTREYKAYINGNLDMSGTFSTNYNIGNNLLYIGTNAAESSKSPWNIYGKMSEWIFEDKIRTAQEVSDYFNGTKSNYGL